MPLGIISDDELMGDLENCSTEIKRTDIKIPEILIEEPESSGRKDGDNNVPSALRALISETAQLDGRKDALQFANSFGISASSVSAYTKEVNSTNQFNQPAKPEIKDHVNKIKRNLSRKARAVMKDALNNITTEKLEEAKAIELASIAKSMSSIVNEMEPPTVQEDKSVPQIVIYAPQMRTENSFEYISVSE